MNCVSCGCSQANHVRADGSCVTCPCKGFIEQWDEPAPPPPVTTDVTPYKGPERRGSTVVVDTAENVK